MLTTLKTPEEMTPLEAKEEWRAYIRTNGAKYVTLGFLDGLMNNVVDLLKTLKTEATARTDALEARIRELESRPKAMVYRGTWNEREKYVEGDFTTCAGSVWACRRDNISTRPGGTPGVWTLAVKAGRDVRPPQEDR